MSDAPFHFLPHRLDWPVLLLATAGGSAWAWRKRRQDLASLPRTVTAAYLLPPVFVCLGSVLALEDPTNRASHLGWLVMLAFCAASSLTVVTWITRLSTELRQKAEAAAQLEKTTQAITAASNAKSEFLALMSHEVRTPLGAILGFATALGETPLDPKQRRCVDTINWAGNTLIDLLNHILDYTRVESGNVKLERVAWTPALLIHEVMELMSVRAGEKGLQMHFDNHLPAGLTLLGDPVHLRQIVLNLVSNAVKFTARGSVRVRADWQPKGAPDQKLGCLSIAVSDTGVGIAHEKIPTLFQAFSQASSATTRSQSGTGLGLTICKKLSDLMNATLELESTVKRGSTFTFRFETESVAAVPTQSDAERTTVPRDEIWASALVVDDTKLNRELLKVMLRRLGVEADVAASGPEAVERVAQHRYDVILMDLEMPGMDGFATARQIRANGTPGSVPPIVAVSALTAAGTREKCLACGMEDYLTKPANLQALHIVLRSRLRERTAVAISA